MEMFSPPFGIPIPEKVHDQYSPELKAAWVKFHDWWKKVNQDEKESIEKASMPEDVRKAYDLINKTPIPGYEQTGSESCYMIAVNTQLTD